MSAMNEIIEVPEEAVELMVEYLEAICDPEVYGWCVTDDVRSGAYGLLLTIARRTVN